MPGILHNSIKCAICQHAFFSVLIDPDQQCIDLLQKLTLHINNRHREDLSRSVESTKILAQVMVTYVFMNNMVVIPEDNINLTKYSERITEEMFKHLGYDDSDEGEENEEDEELQDRIIQHLEKAVEYLTDLSDLVDVELGKDVNEPRELAKDIRILLSKIDPGDEEEIEEQQTVELEKVE